MGAQVISSLKHCFATPSQIASDSVQMAKAMKAMKAAPMKAMKAAKAMKAMKAKKPKVVSKIAKGKMSKAVVFKGNKEKTKTGLTKAMLIKSKSGKIVTKKQSAAGKKAYKNIQGWTKAVQQAKKSSRRDGLRDCGR